MVGNENRGIVSSVMVAVAGVERNNNSRLSEKPCDPGIDLTA